MTRDGTNGGPNRRGMLIALAGIVPAAYMLDPLAARPSGEVGDFIHASRIITGSDALSVGIGQRIEALLHVRIPGFATTLGDLTSTFSRTGGERDAMLAALSETQVAAALEIARPWYLGYVGDPADTILHDDAVFATYLEAQSFDKILDVVPRPTYPGNNAGWWVVPPPGVDAPSMPAAIADWTYHPGGPSAIAAPDPAWRSYAVADHASIADARSAKP